jgi:iron complex outermembrane receptor protein
MKLAVILAASTSLICWGQQAMAQSTAQQGVIIDASSSEAQDLGPGDIIVTATKRSQSLQKAPAAITAVAGDALAARGITDLSAASALIPSARFNIDANAVQISIRGVGSAIDKAHVPESVAMQLNGVYVPRLAARGAFLDLDRIEVLPGPQGTLYGRSAIGGVVNLNTKRPTFETEGDVTAEGGNYGTAHVTGVLNVPLSDITAIRAAADYNHHDAYNNNGTDDLDALATRLSLLTKPSEDLTVFLWGGYSHATYLQSPTFYLPLIDNPRDNVTVTDPLQAFFYPPDGYSNSNPRTSGDIYQVGGQIDLGIGAVTLTYIPGYTHYKSTVFGTIAGFPLQWRGSGNMFSNELRLSNSGSGKLNWLVGLYQFHTRDRHEVLFGVPPGTSSPLLNGENAPSRQNTYAGFGQATFSVADDIRLTAGGRYSWQNLKTVNGASLHGEFPDFTPIAVTFAYNESWKRFDWKIGAEADIGPRSMIYANVQTGFNPGTVRVDYPAQGMKIQPQKMLGFTAGSKNQLFSNRLQANVELFYYRYSDQIIQAQELNTSIIVNAPRSRMYGVQFDGAYFIAADTTVRVNVGYLNAKITTFSNASVNLAGYDLPFAPKWTASTTLEHSFLFSSGGKITFSGNMTYNSGYWLSFEHPADLYQKSFTKTDASLTYHFPNGQWDIGAWIRNIENENVIAAAATTGAPPPNSGAAFLEAPRTFGVRARVRF